MGYYVTLIDSDFVIPETPEVLAAIKDMDVRFDALKRGGVFGGERNGEKWFSWMPQLSTFDTVRNVFVALGFEVYADGDTDSFGLSGYDSKTGQEDLFLAVVAPFVKDGSYTSWRSEDGELYRFTVEKGRLRSQSAVVQWTPSEPLGIGHFDSVKREDGTYHSYHIIVDPYEDDADTIMNLIDDKVSEVTA
jgi:hypothetical protein